MLFLPVVQALAAPETVFEHEAQVVGQTKGTTLEKVRAEALGQALREAVERGAAGLLDPLDYAGERPLLNTEVFSKAKDYVLSQEVVTEEAGPGALTVTARAALDIGALRAALTDLGLAVKETPGSVVLVITANKDGGVGLAQQSAWRLFERAFQGWGVWTARPHWDRGKSLRDPVLQKALRDHSALAALGAECGASLAAAARLDTSLRQERDGRSTAAAFLKLEIVDTQTRELVVEFQETFSVKAKDSSCALRRMGAELAGRVAGAAAREGAAFLKGKDANPASHCIALVDSPGYLFAARFQQAARVLPKLQNLVEIRYKDDRLECKADYQGPAGELAADMVRLVLTRPGLEHTVFEKLEGECLRFRWRTSLDDSAWPPGERAAPGIGIEARPERRHAPSGAAPPTRDGKPDRHSPRDAAPEEETGPRPHKERGQAAAPAPASAPSKATVPETVAPRDKKGPGRTGKTAPANPKTDASPAKPAPPHQKTPTQTDETAPAEKPSPEKQPVPDAPDAARDTGLPPAAPEEELPAVAIPNSRETRVPPKTPAPPDTMEAAPVPAAPEDPIPAETPAPPAMAPAVPEPPPVPAAPEAPAGSWKTRVFAGGASFDGTDRMETVMPNRR
jgi:hypothetical protein